jgi:protease-4
VTYGQTPGRLARLLPGRNLLEAIATALRLELAWTGQPLWLYRP